MLKENRFTIGFIATWPTRNILQLTLKMKKSGRYTALDVWAIDDVLSVRHPIMWKAWYKYVLRNDF